MLANKSTLEFLVESGPEEAQSDLFIPGNPLKERLGAASPI